MQHDAPYFADIADGPADARAFWRMASDGVRLRLGLWRPDPTKDTAGTVLLLPGRTEFIEKYGRTARDFVRAGLTTLAIDWRGQGLSDRLTDDVMSGHVLHFDDYQRDVAVLLEAARDLDLPQPWFVLGHSMGGGIALQAVMDGLPVAAAAFSAPMWASTFPEPCARSPGRLAGAAVASASITSTPPVPRAKAMFWPNPLRPTA